MDGPQYLFGVTRHGGQERMYLRTKAEGGYLELPTGYQERREEYPDSVVTHRYYVERAIDRKEDTYYYVWHLLLEYSKTVDYSPAALAAARQAEEKAAANDMENKLAIAELAETLLGGVS